MSALVLIRHGQASWGSADYDVLSECGVQQSRRLGDHLAKNNVHFDAIYTGPRKRHLDTARHMRDAATAAGAEPPEPIVIDALDELPAFELIAHWRPIIEEREPDLAKQILTGSTRAMALILERWATGELDSGDHESYFDFRNRVRGALDRIRDEQGRKKNVGVVTSGGTIAIGVGYSLELAPPKTIALIWSIVNSSTTELHYRDDELGLSAFNRVAHLAPDLVTTR